MAQQLIGIGAVPDDGTGDPLRTAFTKTNDNFAEVYAETANNFAIKVDRAGDTLTGPLVLAADPVNAMEAATKQYVDAGLAAQDNTDEITEGVTNLYFTDPRVWAALNVTDTGGFGALTYNSATGVFTFTGPSASEIRAQFNVQDNGGDGSLSYSNVNGEFTYQGPTAAETRAHFSVQDSGGDGSLAYNNATGVITYVGPSATEVRAHFSASGDITYDSNTGDFSVTTYKSADFDTDLATKTTDDVAEGSNLYYTDARVGTYLTANSYATETYVDTEIANLIDQAPTTLDTLNELAAALGDDPNFATTVATDIGLKLNTADFNSTFDTQLATKTTDDVAEGNNLYYTTARANADFDTQLATKTSDDVAEGAFALYYTDERVDDRVGTLVQGGTNVDIVYNDTAGSLTINLDVTGGIDLSSNSTSDLSEGTNLYYTNARVATHVATLGYISLATLKAEVAASSDFNDFQNRIAAL